VHQHHHLTTRFEQRVKQAPCKAEVNVGYSHSTQYSLLKFPRWGVDLDDNDNEIQEGPTRSSQAPNAKRKGKILLNDKRWPTDTHLYCIVGKTPFWSKIIISGLSFASPLVIFLATFSLRIPSPTTKHESTYLAPPLSLPANHINTRL
jgi:hypothetical protein